MRRAVATALLLAALPESLARGMHLTCLRDPDGNLVELIGPRSPAPR